MSVVSHTSLAATAFSALLGVTVTSSSAPSVAVDVLKLYPCIVPTNSIIEKLYVAMSRKKTLMIETYLSVTIAHVKRNIQDQIGLPTEQQELTFGGQHLDHGRTLKDYQVRDASTLRLLGRDGMKIVVKTLTGRALTFGVEPDDTIEYLKELIEEQQGIPPSNQRLIFAGKRLQDEYPLSHYNITNESTVFLVIPSVGGMQIFIKILAGKMIPLDVKSEDTIGNVKEKIQHKEHILVDQQRLTYDDKLIHPRRTLSYYHIQKGNTLQLEIIPSSQEKRTVVIRTPSDQETIIDCVHDSTVYQLKRKIEQVMGIPVEEQCLTEDGDLLLSDNACEYDHILTLFPPIRVKLQLVDKTLVNRILFSPWSIGQVQNEIEQTLGIQKLRSRLICNGQELETNKLVSDYNQVVKNDSIIIVQQRYLLTVLPSTKMIWITDHDSVGDIKQLIEEKLNIPQQHQVLFMHNDFQTNTQQTFPYSTPNVAVYVVDSVGDTALLCIELPNNTCRPLLLNKPWTVSNLNQSIERDFGYAIQAQEIRLRHEAHTRSDLSQVENDRPTSQSFFETQDEPMLSNKRQITTGNIISLSSNTPHLFWRETSSQSDIHDSAFLPSTSVQEVIDSLARKHNVYPIVCNCSNLCHTLNSRINIVRSPRTISKRVKSLMWSSVHRSNAMFASFFLREEYWNQNYSSKIIFAN